MAKLLGVVFTPTLVLLGFMLLGAAVIDHRSQTLSIAGAVLLGSVLISSSK